MALLALNNESATPTRVAVVREINQMLPTSIVNVLRNPDFSYRHDDSFETNGYTLITPSSSFLSTIEGYEESRCAIFTNCHTKQAEIALCEWMKAAETVAEDIILHPGELLLFNNYRCVHGRGEVSGNRWLKRVYGSRASNLIDNQNLISIWEIASNTTINHDF